MIRSILGCALVAAALAVLPITAASSEPVLDDGRSADHVGNAGPATQRAGGRDQVINDDLIVDGRLCAGTSCADGETFPVAPLHLTNGNTPGMRLEQDASGGFTAQSWDMAANEANFFIRDATAGSRLVFRIQPGVPANSLTVKGPGQVGIGTWTPQARLDVVVPDASNETALFRVSGPVPVPGDPRVDHLRLDPDGDLYVAGNIVQLSSAAAKTGFSAIQPAALLEQVMSLPIRSWRYRHQAESERHVGPTAEDFHAAFGLGGSDQTLAVADVAGVALAATQALQSEVASRDRRIEALEARLARIEAALEARVADDE